MYLEISQSLQENTCARVSFLIKLKASGLQLYLKETMAQAFSVNFVKYLRTPFLKNTSGQLLLHRKIAYSVLSKHVRDNIAEENYLYNIGPDHAATILKENNLHNFVLVCLGQDCTKQQTCTLQKQPPEVFCIKKVFLKISQYLQENTSFFLTKLQAFSTATLLKRNSTTDV